jgi:hypothetical protein
MYFANFAPSLLKTYSHLKVVEKEIQGPEDVRDLPVFYIFSPFISIKTIQYYFLYSYS